VKQLARLQQILWQQDINSAFRDPVMIKSLGLSDSQVEAARSLKRKSIDELSEYRKSTFPGGRVEGDKDIENLRSHLTRLSEKLREETLTLLTVEQRTKFDSIIGPPSRTINSGAIRVK